MKTISLLTIAAALASSVSAHYIFTSLILNGQTTPAYQYVRRNTNSNSPVLSVTSNDIRCNVGGASGGSTQTASVAAGSTVGFALDQAIFHAGPIAVYLGKAPSTAASWDGSGANWFKIYEVGATISPGAIAFPADGKTSFTFKLPSSVPAGQYLLRIEHIALHSAGSPQFYVSCAQLNITGGGSANPAKVSIPGYVSASDPGLTVNIYYPIPTSYKVPGPSVFSG
ncbi:glycoside hydrolase family 61 protein [Botryobasidium botryosum FD-172 SS1]|uniref:AA9 family lytic polysaccharide monooxygenase n=1 Tax=Botryobasidium botryosum (strain FD-172 SS1) TaxID=930990 RepID=A0A067NAJ9_BOTB1|nr:glycoside hydrolase family 61 protein [Botryobasidium botryosum FD-172 SS1]